MIQKPIILVGLMGCGKSAIGKILAKELKREFIDLDSYIELHTGKTITKIFEEHGEEYFRDLEVQYISDIILKPNLVIATGGGAFINEKIRELIKQHAVSIWIRADYYTLLERVTKKKNRPILEKGNKAQILAELMDARYPIYEKADITVDTSRSRHDFTLKRIMKALSSQLS